MKFTGASLGEFIGRAFAFSEHTDNAHSRLGAIQQIQQENATAPVATALGPVAGTTKRWDVFFGHASEDKELFVRPLAQLLSKRGLAVWFDEQALNVGDSLRSKIDDGLAKSRFGVVVLSPSFFSKRWPQNELDGLVAREVEGHKVILPISHQLSEREIVQFSPLLAGRVAISAQLGLEVVANAIVRAIRAEASG